MKPKSSEKKWVLLALAGLALVMGLARFTSIRSSQPANNARSDASATVETSTHDSRPRALRTRANPGDASRKVIAHRAADFAHGEHNNVRVKDGLQMGDDPTFVYQLEPGGLFGVYLSPEEKTLEPFDTLIVTHDVTTPESSSLECAFRIKPEGADWSDWEEISAAKLNKPVLLGTSALSWQYRLTFRASSAAASPRVRGVTVTTQQSDPVQLSMNLPSSSSADETPDTEQLTPEKQINYEKPNQASDP